MLARALVTIHSSSVVDVRAFVGIGSRAWLGLRCRRSELIVELEDELALINVSVSVHVLRGVSWEAEIVVHKPSLVVQGLEVVSEEHVEATVALIVLPHLHPVVLSIGRKLAFIEVLGVPFRGLEGHYDVLGLPLSPNEIISLFSPHHFVIDLELDVVRCPFDFIFMPISIRVNWKMLEALLHGAIHYLSASAVRWVYLHFNHVEVCDLVFPIVTSEEG